MLILFNIHYVTSYADGLFVNIKMPGGRVETHKMTQWQDGCSGSIRSPITSRL